VGRYPRTPHM